MPDQEDLLRRSAQLEEPPFRSAVPVVGPLIAWFRTRWNEVAARWFVLPLVEQQNAFNALVVAQLEEFEERLIAQDRQLTQLAHDVATLTARLAQLSQGMEEQPDSQVKRGD